MADTYTTEAIACGLSDVAGWLENEGGREKHARTIRLGVERLRELGAAAHPGEAVPRGEEPQPALLYSALGKIGFQIGIADNLADKLVWEAAARAVRGAVLAETAPSHPGEADRVGLGDAWSEHSPQEIVRRTRCAADENMFPTAWRACCDLILKRLGPDVPASLAALGTGEGSGGASITQGEIVKLIAKTWLTAKGTDDETADEISDPGELAMISPEDYAACVEIAQTLLHRFSHPQAPNTLSEVEEARAVLTALDPRMPPQRHIEKLRRSSMRMTLPANADKLLATADRIEAALVTLRASQEQDGEVRRG
jgi:hypothetical protein